jgi:hypothetical protein
MRRRIVVLLTVGLAVALAPSAGARSGPKESDPHVPCRGFGQEDPTGDAPLDVEHAGLELDCRTGTWLATFVQPAAIADDEPVDLAAVWLDVDRDLTDGCQGFDFVVTARPGAGTVFRVPGCGVAFPEVGRAEFRRSSGEVFEVSFAHAAIGSPDGAVRTYLEVESAGRSDFVPDSGVGVVPGEGASFSNGRCEIPYDTAVAAASIERLYLAAFDRQPDAEGAAYWLARYTTGEACLTDLAHRFTVSPEFAARYGNLDDAAFVDRFYQDVLGRAPDADGAAYWRQQLAAGTSRGALLVLFAESAEFRTSSGVA